MSQNSDSETTVLTLDADKIGTVLVRLGLLSHALGHKSIWGTLNPYCNHPDLSSPEVRFVHDLLTLDTRQIIDRWYGGASGAMDMHLATLGGLV